MLEGQIVAEPLQGRSFTPDGRLVIPEGGPAAPGYVPPFSAAGMVVDVLRKRVDLTVGEPSVWVLDLSGNVRDPRYVCWLDVPLDVEWLRRTAQLPRSGAVQVGESWKFGVCVDVSGDVIASAHRAEDPRWVAAGWRAGEPFDGPLPDLHRALPSWRRRRR